MRKPNPRVMKAIDGAIAVSIVLAIINPALMTVWIAVMTGALLLWSLLTDCC